VDEGSYYIVRTAAPGTGVATIAALATYTDLSPFLIVTNNNPAAGRGIFLDSLKLITVTPGTNGTDLRYATKLDVIPRYASGGFGCAGTGIATNVLMGPGSTNMGAPCRSNALVYAGALVGVASTPNLSRLLENGIVRTVIPVAGDQYLWRFGTNENVLDQVAIQTAAITQRSIPHVGVEIAPGHSFVMHIWSASQSVAASYELMLGYRER
jgi:hypothetical protein